MTRCYIFVATEKGGGATNKCGLDEVPMRHVSMEYTDREWRDAGGRAY